MGGMKHSFVSAIADGGDPTVVRPTNWNDAHVGSGHPLDSYALDGTVGDDFTASSLSGIWTRRNFTSGDETYQLGKNGTYMRVALPTNATPGAGYLQSASADGTYACKFIQRNFSGANFGLALVDSAGSGVVLFYYSGPPAAYILASLTTYTGYGGTYVEAGYSGASPNVALFAYDPTGMQRAVWLATRKAGSSCFASISLDGEIWGPESSAFTWAGTMDRAGMLCAPLGVSTASQGVVDIDWFNKL